MGQMENTEPTEEEFKFAVKNILLKKLDKLLKPCTEYPTAKQMKQKFKLERKP